MSTEDFKIAASHRDAVGKGASRRLRREQGTIPAIVYGGDQAPENIAVNHNALMKHLDHEAFYSHIIELDIDGKKQDVILKDLQRNPVKPGVFHADFMRVSATSKLQTKVPLHFLNEEKSNAVKNQGAKVTHVMTELDILCFPKDLPEFIEIDLIDAQIGQIIHISDVKLPEGVESVDLAQGADHDLPVVSINKAKGAAADEEEDGEKSED